MIHSKTVVLYEVHCDYCGFFLGEHHPSWVAQEVERMHEIGFHKDEYDKKMREKDLWGSRYTYSVKRGADPS